MSAPDPRANPALFGHAGPQAMLAEALASGRMHHAWLITGPPGIGKATLAFRFARRLLAGRGEGDGLALPPADPVFRRVAAASHADLLTVEREWDPKRRRRRGEIVVDDVRRIAEFLRLTPAEGGWRVVVIDGAEDLNRNAANALLKVLEEPPPRAVLLLVCAAPGRLLPTIRSRCRRLGLAPLDAPAMDEALATLLPETPPADRARLAALAEGSPGRALQLAASDGVAYAELVAEVMGAPDGVGVLRAHALADTLGRQEDGFAIFLDLLRGALAASVRAAARGRPPAPLIARRPLDAWVDIWHALGALLDETENLYLDKRHALVAGLDLLASPPSRPMRET